MKQTVLSLRLQKMAQRESSANGPSLEPGKGRQHDAKITVLSSLYGGVNAQHDDRSAAGLRILAANRTIIGTGRSSRSKDLASLNSGSHKNLII